MALQRLLLSCEAFCISRESIGTRVGHRSLLLRSVRVAVESPRTCYAHSSHYSRTLQCMSLSYVTQSPMTAKVAQGRWWDAKKVRVWRCACALAVGGS